MPERYVWIALFVTVAVGVLLALVLTPSRASHRRMHHAMVSQDIHLPSLQLQGHAGAYDIFEPGQIDVARRMGLSFSAVNYTKSFSPYAFALRRNGMRAIDRTPWALILREIPRRCRLTTKRCDVPASQRRRIFAEVRTHLGHLQKDDTVGAFYILDDYPGNIRGILDRVAQLVHESNSASRFKRPTVCAFAFRLDGRHPEGAPSRPDPIAQAALNFSLRACDFVLLYAYGAPGEADYSMSHSLPHALSVLGQRGWRHSREPLIGAPQTFGSAREHPPAPTALEVRTQTDAYCRHGASAILAYAWAGQPAQELATDSGLRAGLEEGLMECHRMWSHRH